MLLREAFLNLYIRSMHHKKLSSARKSWRRLKKTLLCTATMTLSIAVTAQKKETTQTKADHFNASGIFVPEKRSIPYNYNVEQKITIPYVDSAVTESDFKKIKKLLLGKVRKTISYLKEENVSSQYQHIWDSAFYRDFLDEAIRLEKYIESGGAPDKSIFVPGQCEIENIKKRNIYEQEYKDSDDAVVKIWLLRKDPFKSFLVEHYNKFVSTDTDIVVKLKMDYDYMSAWRQLEDWYEMNAGFQEELKLMNASMIYDTSRMREIRDELQKQDLSKNLVVNAIRASKLVKEWLWFNEGVVLLNPFVVAGEDRRYPATERNRFQTAQMKAGLDSLQKTGYLKQWTESKVIYNKLLLPIDPDANRRRSVFMAGPQALLAVYDADKQYKLMDDVKHNLHLSGYDDQLSIVVHNIPADRKLEHEQQGRKMADESPFMAELNDLATQVGTMAGIIQPKIGALSLITEAINPSFFKKAGGTINPGVSIVRNIDNTQRKNLSNALNGQTLMQLKALPSSDELTVQNVVPPVTKMPEFFLIGNTPVPITKDNLTDKRNILWVSDNNENFGPGKPDTLFSKIVEVFLLFDRYFFLDYSNSALKKSVENLIDRFDAFKVKDSAFKKELKNTSDSLYLKFKAIEAFLSISNRSLPQPEKIKEKVNPDYAVYRSEIIPVSQEKETKEISIKVTETTTDAKLTKKTVFSHNCKVSKRHRFDVSIGLAYSVKDYQVIFQSGTNLPVTEVADRLQFMAGANFYPFRRMNKLDGKFLGNFYERVSVFGALGVKYPLDNYFAGISYDIVPGLKTVAGWHWYRDQRFKILNDQVSEKSTKLTPVSPFFSLNLEPATLLKVIGLIN